MNNLKKNRQFGEELINAIPAAVFVVDYDLQVKLLNRSAMLMTCKREDDILEMKGGDVLGCINASRNPEGCGKSDACADCVVRNSVRFALNGENIYRRRAEMTLMRDGRKIEAYLLVTASPFEVDGTPLVLLSLEDISELTMLRKIIPICSVCKKVRDDENYWLNVETYFKNQLKVDFSHGLCQECAEKYYQDFIGNHAK